MAEDLTIKKPDTKRKIIDATELKPVIDKAIADSSCLDDFLNVALVSVVSVVVAGVVKSFFHK